VRRERRGRGPNPVVPSEWPDYIIGHRRLLQQNRHETDMPSKLPHVRFSALGGPMVRAKDRRDPSRTSRRTAFGSPISLAASLLPEREAGDRSDTRGAPVWSCPSSKSATFELNGYLFDLPERTTGSPVVVCSRPLGRRDDKQNDPNRYGQQNRQGD
jgi:hypothetical protein